MGGQYCDPATLLVTPRYSQRYDQGSGTASPQGRGGGSSWGLSRTPSLHSLLFPLEGGNGGGNGGGGGYEYDDWDAATPRTPLESLAGSDMGGGGGMPSRGSLGSLVDAADHPTAQQQQQQPCSGGVSVLGLPPSPPRGLDLPGLPLPPHLLPGGGGGAAPASSFRERRWAGGTPPRSQLLRSQSAIPLSYLSGRSPRLPFSPARPQQQQRVPAAGQPSGLQRSGGRGSCHALHRKTWGLSLSN